MPPATVTPADPMEPPFPTTPFVVLNSGRDIGKAESQIAIASRVVSQCRRHIQTRDTNPIVRHAIIDIEAIGCAEVVATIDA